MQEVRGKRQKVVTGGGGDINISIISLAPSGHTTINSIKTSWNNCFKIIVINAFCVIAFLLLTIGIMFDLKLISISNKVPKNIGQVINYVPF